MLTALAVPALAIDNITLDEMDELMGVVADAAEDVPELGESAGSLADSFRSFMNVAGTVGSVLTLINGSVTFLKLIGIMKDPAAENTAKILEQIGVMNEKLDKMDAKLDDLAQQMKEMQATMELNNRGIKAYNMRLAWSDFSQDYVEDGMEKLMTQYDAMLATGLGKWCRNESTDARRYNGVDNTEIVILYGDDGKGGYAPMYSDCAPDAIPSDCPRYAVLKADCLPASFGYDADHFHDALAADIAARIRTALDGENYDAFDSLDIPFLTPEGKEDITDGAIAALAEDAVNALVYRVAAAEVNASADFAYEVDRQFTNYCSHLLASEQGIDAMFKSFYLTHSFEFEVKQDLKDFCNRMILKTGTYGLFVLNVLGMSHYATSDKKQAAASRFYDTGMALEKAKTSAFTGWDDFCYITNSRMSFTPVALRSDGTLKIYHSGEVTAYRGFSAGKIGSEIEDFFAEDGSFIGDEKALVLYYTLNTSGYEGRLYDYLRLRISRCVSDDLGPVVTSLNGESTLPLDDGKVRLQSRRAIGRYFNDSSRYALNALPEDAESKYILCRKQLTGSTLDLDSGKLAVNTPLHAMALYGENHWYWFTDEAAGLGGVAGRDGFNSAIRLDKQGYNHTYTYSSESRYNALVTIPVTRLTALDAYDPLASYAELWDELEEENKGFVEPPKPIDVPRIGSVDEIDLTDTVWDAPTVDETLLTAQCAKLAEQAAQEAGVSLSAEESAALAQSMAAQYRKAEQRLVSDETLYPDDPLGLGQNSAALRERAGSLLPDYLLNDAGKPSMNVAYLFVRMHYDLRPAVSFDEKGEAKVGVTYEALPYLIVGDTSAGVFQWLILPFEETEKTSFTEYAEPTPEPEPTPTPTPEPEAPPTGDDAAVTLYAALGLLSLAGAAYRMQKTKDKKKA